MKHLIWLGVIVLICLLFAPVVKSQDGIDIEKRTYMKSLMCAKHEYLTGNL